MLSRERNKSQAVSSPFSGEIGVKLGRMSPNIAKPLFHVVTMIRSSQCFALFHLATWQNNEKNYLRHQSPNHYYTWHVASWVKLSLNRYSTWQKSGSKRL